MGKTTQQLYNDYTYEKRRFSERKTILEDQISVLKGKIRTLNEYIKELTAINEEIKPLVNKYATIGEYLKEVCPDTDGKPMDKGKYTQKSGDVSQCVTNISNLITEVESKKQEYTTEKSRSESQLNSVNSSISYYSNLIRQLRM